MTARVVVRRAAQPIPLSPARAARRGGLVVLSGRAAHETTLAGLEARPGARHLYGEVRCEAIERLQREALEAAAAGRRARRPQRPQRGPPTRAHLYAKLERILRPIVDAEERRAGARLVRAGKETAARDAVGLRALNDALRAAFDAPGRAGLPARRRLPEQPPLEEPERSETSAASRPGPPAVGRRHSLQAVAGASSTPASSETVSPHLRPGTRPARTPIDIATDPGLSLASGATRYLRRSGGWSRVSGKLRALVSAEPGSQLSVREAGGHDAELLVSSSATTAAAGCEIARKDEDSHVEPSSSPRPGPSPFTKADASSRRSSAPPGRPASHAREYASTSPTGCSRSRWPRTPSTGGPPTGYSSGDSPASDPQTRPSTPPPSASRRRYSATGSTTS